MVQQTLDGAATTSRKRNSYSREEKLRIIKQYDENGKNLYQTCKYFALNSKTVIPWLANIRPPNVFVDAFTQEWPTSFFWFIAAVNYITKDVQTCAQGVSDA